MELVAFLAPAGAVSKSALNNKIQYGELRMAASQSQYRIVISLRDGGGILVERQLQIAHQWKTIDRYNTHDLTKELKRTDPWIAEVLVLCSHPSAAIEIAIPKVPPLLPTQAERLAAYDAKAREMEMQAQHDAEFRSNDESFVGQAFDCSRRQEL